VARADHQQRVAAEAADGEAEARGDREQGGAHFAPRIAARSGQWDFLVAMAAAGLGSTLMPAPLLARLNLGPELAVRPLADPAFAWDVALVWSAERYMSHAARAWLKVCEAVLVAQPRP